MVLRPLRPLPPRPAHDVFDSWLDGLEHQLADPAADRVAICRRTLLDLVYPQFAANYDTAIQDEMLPLATRAALISLDPRHITLEPEYYAECDDEKFQRVKPLLWLWYSFDRTAIAGQNVDIAHPFPAHPRAAHLQALRQELQSVPERGVLLRLQHRGRRRRRDPSSRAARRPRRPRCSATA